MKSNQTRTVGIVARSDRYLKSENQIWLFGFLVVNVAAFAVVTYIGLDGVPRAIQWIQSHWESLSAVGIGVVVTTIVSNLVSPQLKAVLVFWRWPNPLPGHRAFTQYLTKDPRIDPHRLSVKIGDFPNDPSEQNRLWYRIYRTHKSEPSVMGAHKDFLLTRDITWLSFAMFILFGLGSAFLGESALQITWYPVLLGSQYLVASIAARRNGIRFVLNVLAIEASDRDAVSISGTSD